MDIGECCKQSKDAYDFTNDTRFFVQTERRSPLGWEIVFFDCQGCGSRWKRQKETLAGGDLYWVRLHSPAWDFSHCEAPPGPSPKMLQELA